MGDIDAAGLFQFGCKIWPEIRRFPAPAGIGRQVPALPLDPEQAEIPPRSPKRHVPFIDQNDLGAGPQQAVRGSGPDQASADGWNVLALRGPCHQGSASSKSTGLDFTPTWRK